MYSSVQKKTNLQNYKNANFSVSNVCLQYRTIFNKNILKK